MLYLAIAISVVSLCTHTKIHPSKPVHLSARLEAPDRHLHMFEQRLENIENQLSSYASLSNEHNLALMHVKASLTVSGDRLHALERALEVERALNLEQKQQIDRLLQRLDKRQQWADIPLLMSIAFFGLLGICLVSIRVQFSGFSFSVPVEILLKALEGPAIASLVTGGVTIALKIFEKKLGDGGTASTPPHPH